MTNVGVERTDRWRLFWAAHLTLFVELALIRWLGENVIYLSYFTNFVLIASFLGIGIGFLTSTPAVRWFARFPAALFILVSLVIAFPVKIDRPAGDVAFVGFGAPSGAPLWVVLPVVFVAVTLIMVGLGQLTAHYFARFEALTAYRLDIWGALTGIVSFTVLSFLGAPPVVWGFVVAALAAWLGRSQFSGLARVTLVGVVVILGAQSSIDEYSWSPYYRLEVIDRGGQLFLNTNGIPHQAIRSIATVDPADDLVAIPYRLFDSASAERVLVIGAGNGVDVALALQLTAATIDAVEIDRGIVDVGRRLNPDRPYDDDRVTVHVDDGRAFLENADDAYDVILFALPDSLTLVSGQSSLRLESYLFTVEAFEAAAQHLSPSGVFVMYNVYPSPWVIDRLVATGRQTFEGEPCVIELDDVPNAAVVGVGPGLICPEREAMGTSIEPITDDRPFLYIEQPGIPRLYLVAAVVTLLGSLVAVAWSSRSRSARGYGDLFAMGAAFLLLETKSVVQFSLWFGTTWVVNSLVFAGVLLSVLLAIEVARRGKAPRLPLLYGALGLALGVAWLVPPSLLLSVPLPLRWVAGVALTFAPIFIANLVFAERFRSTASSTVAFAVNLLGAILGGVIEYAALAVGYRHLIIAVAAFYALAFGLWRRQAASRSLAV